MSKQGHISITESDNMIYLEFTTTMRLLNEILKEINGPTEDDLDL